MARSISKSVGKGGVNQRQDVTTIQELINANIGKITPLAPLTVDGLIGKKTIGAIEEFQRRVVRLRSPDGRVDPGGKTLRFLNQGAPVGGRPTEDEEDVTKIPSGTGPFFPFTKLPKAAWDWTTGWRRFASNRSSGRRAHAGCDLYFPEGTPIHAVKDGTIVRREYYFYADTYAIEVDHGNFLVRYGEIKKGSGTSKTHVSAGEVIARVGHLVGISVPSDMCHFEMYDKSASGPLTVKGANSAKRSDGVSFQRRKDLIDPTPYLNRWKNNLPK